MSIRVPHELFAIRSSRGRQHCTHDFLLLEMPPCACRQRAAQCISIDVVAMGTSPRAVVAGEVDRRPTNLPSPVGTQCRDRQLTALDSGYPFAPDALAGSAASIADAG